MTQEDKQLLLKDLSARLPYGVKIACGPYDKNPINVNSISIVDIGTFLNGYFTKGIQLNFNGKKELWPKPYLRSMSSMTEEEREEYKHLVAFSGSPDGAANFVDWLNKKMFAYRTIDGKDMFELGLALEAPKDMYKI